MNVGSIRGCVVILRPSSVPTQTLPNESTTSAGRVPPGFPVSNGMVVNFP